MHYIAKYIWGNFFKRKHTQRANAPRVFAEQRRSRWISRIIHKLNGTKSVELDIVYARVHLLNEGGLYKIYQTKKKIINELQFY